MNIQIQETQLLEGTSLLTGVVNVNEVNHLKCYPLLCLTMRSFRPGLSIKSDLQIDIEDIFMKASSLKIWALSFCAHKDSVWVFETLHTEKFKKHFNFTKPSVNICPVPFWELEFNSVDRSYNSMRSNIDGLMNTTQEHSTA